MSAGSDNEDHSWPAFVDALTTMTMILTFVMLILSVAIASLAQNVSKYVIDQISEAIGKPVEPTASAEKSTRDVIEAIEKLKAAAKPVPLQTQPVEQEKKIEATVEEKKPVDKVAATSTQTMLTLKYPVRQSRLDATAEAELKTFLETSAAAKSATVLEVRAFASLAVGSISEAKRFAYYRAMILRSSLITAGIPAEKVNIQVELSNAAEDTDIARIYAK